MTCAVYHWWSYEGEPEAYQNIRSPAVTSIASLRAFRDIPVYVLDFSPQPRDWGGFDDKLNFTVLRPPLFLEPYKEKCEGYRHLSRIFDLYHISSQLPEKNMVYVDSDIFFFQDPFPLAKDFQKFCYDGWNSGFFYWDPSTPSNKLFFDIFEKYTIAAIHSEDIRNMMKKSVDYDAWYGVWDEMVLGFMKTQNPEVFDFIPDEEHLNSKRLFLNDNINEPKVFHGNGSYAKNPITGAIHARGLIPLIVEEFYDNICKVLSPEDLEQIYGQDLLDHFQERRFNLIRNRKNLGRVLNGLEDFHLDNFTAMKFI